MFLATHCHVRAWSCLQDALRSFVQAGYVYPLPRRYRPGVHQNWTCNNWGRQLPQDLGAWRSRTCTGLLSYPPRGMRRRLVNGVNVYIYQTNSRDFSQGLHIHFIRIFYFHSIQVCIYNNISSTLMYIRNNISNKKSFCVF